MPNANINGINIGYQVHGNGEPLILLAGLGGDRNAWFLQVETFKDHYRTITYDTRGTGVSGTSDSPCTIKIMADDTIGLMDRLSIDKAHILGVSMGGMIAQEIAIKYPERVMKLILVSTYFGGDEEGGLTISMRKILGLDEKFSKGDAKSVDIEKFMHNVISMSFNSEKYKRVFIQFSQQYVKMVGQKGFAEQLEAAADCYTLDRLHTINAKTLVIAGTKDQIVPFCSSEIIADKIPDAKLVAIDGGSHSLYIEMSARFNKEIINFLK
jgi:pimeloyl-ACP methyl ester carboxylesterase